MKLILCREDLDDRFGDASQRWTMLSTAGSMFVNHSLTSFDGAL